MPMFNDQQNNNGFNNDFFSFGFIDILSLIIGVVNMQLNITGTDLDNQTKTILKDIHGHLSEQDDHLAEQDKHLSAQDRHLALQDKKIARLEKALAFSMGIAEKE